MLLESKFSGIFSHVIYNFSMCPSACPLIPRFRLGLKLINLAFVSLIGCIQRILLTEIVKIAAEGDILLVVGQNKMKIQAHSFFLKRAVCL
jgi:hypothetical protein